jgi:hypothetical protein
MLNITIFGCIAILISVFLTYYAIQVDKVLIKTYVAILLIAMGIIAILKLKYKSENYRPKLLTFFSGLAGFNKGIGAGGYGPVVMLGQIFSGIYEKTATAIVSVSEGFVSLAGISAFMLIPLIKNVPNEIDFLLLPSVFTGGFIGALISPYMVRILPNKIWKIVIPIYALAIAIYVLMQLFVI